MSVLLHFHGDLRIECDDDEAVLWIRSTHNTVSLELTPRVIEQIEAAIKEARKFRAMGEAA
jgi:uncharacterized protein (DUF1499 family)